MVARSLLDPQKMQLFEKFLNSEVSFYLEPSGLRLQSIYRPKKVGSGRMPDEQDLIVIEEFLKAFEDIPKNHKIYFNSSLDGLITMEHYDENGKYLDDVFEEGDL